MDININFFWNQNLFQEPRLFDRRRNTHSEAVLLGGKVREIVLSPCILDVFTILQYLGQPQEHDNHSVHGG